MPDQGPKTRQLYAAIRRLIETGHLSAGTKLPTTRDLSQRLAVSRGAVVAAFEMLCADGFVEARIGAGTFVSPHTPRIPPDQESSLSGATAGDHDRARPLPGALGIATPDPRTVTQLRRIIGRHLSHLGTDHFHYGDPRGSQRLRDALAGYLRTARGVRCDPGQILITSGTQQGLDILTRALIRPGDAAWIEDPCYLRALTTLKAAGARIVGVAVDSEGIDPDDGLRQHPDARLAYVTPSHQFPLGVVMSMRRRMALLDWAKARDAWIIEDDYDSEFRYAGPPLTSLQGLDGAGRVVYLGTFSKVLFPGLRVGYMVLPEALLAPIVTLRQRMDRQPPTLLETALAEFLDEGHFSAHLRRARLTAKANRDALVEALIDHCGAYLQVTAPEQGLHLVAYPARPIPDEKLGAALARAGLGSPLLSHLFVSAPPRQGVVMGFSGIAVAELRQAVSRLGVALAGSCAGGA